MIAPAAALAERIRDAVVSVDGVTGLHAGTFGDVATYLPGRRVSGVRVGRTGVGVHIIVRPDADIRQVAQAVRVAALAQLDHPLPCTVVVEDLAEAAVGRATHSNAGAPETSGS